MSMGVQGVGALYGASVGDVVPKPKRCAPASIVSGNAEAFEYGLPALVLWRHLQSYEVLGEVLCSAYPPS